MISLLANIAVVAVLGVIALIAKEVGPWVCLGWLGGFFSCYVIFRCWRFDKDPPPTISAS
jgi:hypothetical protein